MAQQKRGNAISSQASDACTPEESPIAETKQLDSDEDDLFDEKNNSQECLDQDEFIKKWDDIYYLMHKQFRCK